MKFSAALQAVIVSAGHADSYLIIISKIIRMIIRINRLQATVHETVLEAKNSTICSGIASKQIHNIWWSKIEIRVCSRFQREERGRHQSSDSY